MTISKIIAELTYFNGVFPHQAVAEAVRQREEITPELLRLLEDAAANIEDIAPQEDYVGHIFAMYLLAQFRETRAYPILVEFFSADQELVELAAGDIITEDLGRILASVCGGDIGPICGMVENAKLDEYVRSGALGAFIVLLAEGAKTRDEVMEYFQSLFHGKLERKLNLVWGSLVTYCCDIYAGEVMGEIEQSFADELIETTFIDMHYVKRHLAEGKDAAPAKLAQDYKQRFIEDTAHELAHWACFQIPRQPVVKVPPKQVLAASMKGRDRNAPCPCGSGKKYKKCCGIQ